MRSLISCFFIAASLASAQPSLERLGVRVNAGFGSISHSGALHATSGIIDCGEITTGSGTGLTGSAGIEFALGSWFGVGLELGIAQRGGDFTRENIYPLRDSATGIEVNMLAAHTLSTTLSTFDIAPQLIIPIIGVFRQRMLGLQIGPRFALVQTASYQQEETVLSPDNAFFIEDGKAIQSRVVDANNFAAATSVLTGVTASLESVISLSDRVALAPRVSYDHFFTSALTDVQWDVRGVRGEIGIRLSIPPATPEFIPPPPPPPPVIVMNDTPASFAPPKMILNAGPFSGEIVTGNALKATIPIVNAVFFDSASAIIPANYRTARDGSTMSSDAVEAHNWIMIRIANIVAENPNAKIILEGATSGQSNEQDATLARQRAENVRRILMNLGVPNTSITVKALQSPTIASNNDLAGGREENRRVDIVVVNAPLQRWVQSEVFAEARGQLSLSASVIGGDPANQPSTITYTVQDTDTTAQASRAITKNIVLAVEPSASTLSIAATASASGIASTRQVDVDLSTLTRRSIALRTDGFEAVLRFDYNSSELTEDVKILLQQLADQLPEGSTITIDGSADVLGSQERNRILSEARATTTRGYVKSITKKAFTFTSSSQSKSYSNDTPQGRFLNRNIRIRVTTP